ncbi:Ig-like domain-containing protein [Shewanella aestuarii]|uniref:Big-1 domain-containing protein n=1 Tax=Shewanella aestuarii TaxID=1028752 RepID=A0A6G9QJT8_9GAMM|nr:invasin domain 3-containing protein [Shewanella aestuarii]QIR14820.1 hypothetical protein HBH39_10240 [Shewanella aestuarii]
MRSAIKVYLALICSFILFACGGGGSISEDGGGVTPPPVTISVSLSVDNTQVSVAEPATLTATVIDSNGNAISTLVTFELNDDSYGTFSPATGQVATNSDGVATVTLNTASINTGATVTATTSTGESAFINLTMVGDGGEAGGGAQVSLVLTDLSGEVVQTISTLSPGKLTATVTGINKPTIVAFESDIGDLPIKTAVTNAQGKATVDIYAGSALGAGEVRAILPTNEVGKTIVVVGATNVVMGSGTGENFEAGKAEVSTTDLSAGGTATITVRIQDDQGNPFTQPVDVNFSSTCATKNPAQAEISSPVSSSNGIATSTYLAQGCVGEDQINVTANAGGISLSAVGTINVLQADVGSISFVSAQPENIGILGTGGVESSTVKFKVLDKNGNPVSNQEVSFSLNTSVGGVAITPILATTNNQGIVQTVVTSGTVATSLRVTATVENGAVPAITSQSKQLIISTGIPDQDSFSLSAEVLNAEGWNRDGTTVVVTARMADAFNNPVPDGTTVSFTTEGGSIEDACQTVKGACSVTWTSQLPRPEGEVIIDGTGLMNRNPDSALSYDPALNVYGNIYGQKYGGRATITATAIGEESFPDLNGNGRFDASEVSEFLNGRDVTGQAFDLNDAFNDYNEDGIFNPQQTGGQNGGALEELIDFNSNGVFDTKDGLYNGVLCSTPAHAGCADGVSDSKSIYVRRSLVMVMSGSKAFATAPDDIIINDRDGIHLGGNITIVGKGAASVYFTISDLHNQQMPAGTIVRFKTTAGSVVSDSEYVWPSTNYNGGQDFGVTLKGEDEPNTGVFFVEVETPSGVTTQVVSIGVTIL